MNADEYQRLSARTLNNKPVTPPTDEEIMLVWCAIGLAGEAGEVNEWIKKVVFHRHEMTPQRRADLHKELGDVMWYLAGICTILGFSLDSVLEMNVEKLRARYEKGFTVEESKHD